MKEGRRARVIETEMEYSTSVSADRSIRSIEAYQFKLEEVQQLIRNLHRNLGFLSLCNVRTFSLVTNFSSMREGGKTNTMVPARTIRSMLRAVGERK